ncbi:cobyric acid synthase [Corynebacterium sp.]|uniref:cobyric acid synthase n=1 Tax=Corynebacterium sp. TaxID=1720 RepID=UPI0026DD66F5|nr:cobyric acid synthase [Corynebacterium sp.]MDO4610891.1 cobyric acid synthase [Corynebacterium sp.]
MAAPAALVAGCTSDAGKSVLVAGMCRLLARRGVRVAPFKAQNMSNNCAVTPDGGEIGRAQALQALACGLEPHVDFNPVLLKPEADHVSQVVVRGVADGRVSALTYRTRRRALRGVVAETLEDLRQRYDVVLCEGAGSPAEVNLRESDIANMGLAAAADLPVIIAGDIDRGGVLAHFVGTHAILDPEDRERITGFIVNKFRGDVGLLLPGLDVVRQHTGVPVLGVIPFLRGLWVDAEDSLGTEAGVLVGPSSRPLGDQVLSVAAVRLPRVSNATDVEALACEPGVRVEWTDDPTAVARADLAVLPGSKSTVQDLAWLREAGIADALTARASRDAAVLGICGGFQMLCRTIDDPVESGAGPVAGLGLLDADIVFAPEKILERHPDGSYEVHNGRVVRQGEPTWPHGEGAVRGSVAGTHRHGLLEDDVTRRRYIADVAAVAGLDGFRVSPDTSFAAERLRQLDLIADAIEEHLAGPALAAATGIAALG